MQSKLVSKLSIALIALVIFITMPLTASAQTTTTTSSDSNTSKAVTIQRSKELGQEVDKLLKTNQPLTLTAKSAIAIDYQTGQVLYAKNINESLPTASMSKILTLYVTLKYIKEGKIHWNDRVKINKALHNLSVNRSYANVKLRLGHFYTIRQLYQTAIYSENAATMALGYGVAGSTQKFALLMRKEAKKIGITDAKIYTACGLTNGEVGSLGFKGVSADAENKLSARDMALLAMRILKYYPDILKTTSANTTKFDGQTMLNWNWMIKGRSQELPDIKVDGLKTGTSDTAKACFTGTAVKNGHRIITVVMGVPNSGQYDPARFIQTRKLMKYVYAKYHYVKLSHGETVKNATNGRNAGKIKVENGKNNSVDLAVSTTEGVWLTKKQKLNIKDIKSTGEYADGSSVDAGFDNGDKIATAKVSNVKYMKGVSQKIDLIANHDGDKPNIFVRFGRWIASLF
ncbi:D-alanyl-D-alanine carboxypeptidase [Lactobacillus kunkeei]|uniref:D-alanyl-D-alanine carboxypeptidase n=1 Tax=Apilactobacillus nanyangensis TaxID=2799579 RepID=A0ABT0HYY4_9LACO|nr:D-alanyl-D-alanine carboxypeptidase family protein [Apilactobacillus nanyangensis]MBC6389258.1 D-alanyl-D-alanine carboxypeptidase [Apilactobacillus kunkeei]MCK8612143.1 D-alanyl-D-alanine carboxypeptidase [Apilactobacillus nanyangensis]TMT00534.1 D-alanyl-D-alanine carboxypeptidase [Apilactobacillus kunkeei]TMT03534.1 D-alanyl-D-alanine carboxypeptidase [Apilactobacillus kunkeei]CAI2630192.1 D-alanyl-D-alanine carboxypeptidase DacA [Apilactobacillus kunkeei]